MGMRKSFWQFCNCWFLIRHDNSFTMMNDNDQHRENDKHSTAKLF